MKLLKSRKLLKRLVLLSKLSKGTVSNEIDKRLEYKILTVSSRRAMPAPSLR